MKRPDWVRSGDKDELPEDAESNLVIIRAVSLAFLLVIATSSTFVARAGHMSPMDLVLTLSAATVVALTSIVAKNKQAIFIASHALVIALMIFIYGICFLNLGLGTAPIVAAPILPALSAKLFKPYTCLFYSALVVAGLVFLLYVSPKSGHIRIPITGEIIFVIWLGLMSASTAFISLYLVRRNNALSQMLKYQSEQDFLTGLPNRYKIHERLFQDVASANRKGDHTAVMMIDVDHFKDFNDRNGHLAGDAALVNVGNRLKKVALQDGGFAGRYGGEEFIFFVSHKDPEVFNKIAEKLRRYIAEMKVEISPSRSDSLTITIGLATNQYQPDVNYEVLIHNADQALYRGKTLGRNRVEAFEQRVKRPWSKSDTPTESAPKPVTRIRCMTPKTAETNDET